MERCLFNRRTGESVSTLTVVNQGELARMLTELMASRGMSQAALARASGVSQTHISRILAGEREPSAQTLDALADALNVDPSHLHRAYAMDTWLDLDVAEDDDLKVIRALWPELPPEQRAAQRAALEAIVRQLRTREE